MHLAVRKKHSNSQFEDWMIKFDIELKKARGLQLMILVDLLYETSEEEQFCFVSL